MSSANAATRRTLAWAGLNPRGRSARLHADDRRRSPLHELW
jgi:hypothetical protein